MELSASNLGCTIDGLSLFAGVSFNLSPGQGILLRGANGSGKSTLLRMLCGLRWPDAGEVRWGQQVIRHVRAEFQASLAYLGHKDGIKDDLTALENLLFGNFHQGVDSTSVMQALNEMELGATADTLGRQLSAGQRRRLALIRVLLSKTRLWLLDEPFTALDSVSCSRLEAHIRQHLQNGGMLVLTSHQQHGLDDLGLKEIHLSHG